MILHLEDFEGMECDCGCGGKAEILELPNICMECEKNEIVTFIDVDQCALVRMCPECGTQAAIAIASKDAYIKLDENSLEEGI